MWIVGYRLTRKAREDVINLYLYGVEEFGQAAADRFQEGLAKAFAFLADYPAAARERIEINPPVRGHPYKGHIIIYIIEGDGILILGIRHGREDWFNSADS